MSSTPISTSSSSISGALNSPDSGATMYQWAKDLFPICRSLTGEGTRQTLAYLTALLPNLTTHSVPSGTKAFDWTVPDEWNIHDAFIADENGQRIVDFQDHNLHVVGYSEPIDQQMTFDELKDHIYYLPDQPTAIPYITSYYKRHWGFCVKGGQYVRLERDPQAKYHVRIDSTLEPGEMNYADLVVPGSTKQEVLFTTYVCHPSMANNELSGPCVQAALARWIERELPDRRLTYRFVFGPETIGAVHYLTQHLDHLKQNLVAGFNLSCLGDRRTYSYLSTPSGNTLADRVAKHVLKNRTNDQFDSYSFLDRGSDERQYCAPGVELPFCVLSRSIFMTYPEYHTSLDNLDLISAEGLEESLSLLKEIVIALENNHRPRCETVGEPQLGPRGLYPSLSRGTETRKVVKRMMDLLAYANGQRDLLEIADTINVPIGDLIPIATQLYDAGVMTKVDQVDA